MQGPDERRLPDELEAVAARLRAGRAHADPLQLDQIKRRVIARCAGEQRRSTFMRSRIATILTVLGLVGGTGGAIAIANGGGGGNGKHGAATGQYCPPKSAQKQADKDCNGDFHSHNHTGAKGKGAGGDDSHGHS